MQDFRLKVFLTAARTLSFTRCAEQLYISQPAVSKHIGELENLYGVKLFTRRGSRLELTEAGHIMERWGERITSLYLQMEYEMKLLDKAVQGELRLGASTTISQYVLPEMIARFSRSFPDIRITLTSDNSEKIEQALFSHEIDLGFTENVSRRNGLHYEHLADDRLVVVADARSKLCGPYSLQTLRSIPIVIREKGSGTLELIAKRLEEAGTSLSSFNIVASLGSSEAIKSYIKSADAISIVSVAAVRKELESGELKIIGLEDIEFTREFTCVTCAGEHNSLAERFISFITHYAKANY